MGRQEQIIPTLISIEEQIATLEAQRAHLLQSRKLLDDKMERFEVRVKERAAELESKEQARR